jgi:hypothetical protein
MATTLPPLGLRWHAGIALQEERLTRVNQGGLPKLTLQHIASDFLWMSCRKNISCAFVDGTDGMPGGATPFPSYAQTTCGTVGV